MPNIFSSSSFPARKSALINNGRSIPCTARNVVSGCAQTNAFKDSQYSISETVEQLLVRRHSGRPKSHTSFTDVGDQSKTALALSNERGECLDCQARKFWRGEEIFGTDMRLE